MKTKKNKINKELAKEAAAYYGSLGGSSTVKKLGKRHMKRIGVKGSNARWGRND